MRLSLDGPALCLRAVLAPDTQVYEPRDPAQCHHAVIRHHAITHHMLQTHRSWRLAIRHHAVTRLIQAPRSLGSAVGHHAFAPRLRSPVTCNARAVKPSRASAVILHLLLIKIEEPGGWHPCLPFSLRARSIARTGRSSDPSSPPLLLLGCRGAFASARP